MPDPKPRPRVLPALVALTCAAGSIAYAGAQPGAASAARRVIVVAPHGHDRSPGTAARPLHTIQVAVRRLGTSGGTILLKGGRYAQRVRLAHVADVTVEPFGSQHPVLDGSRLTAPSDISAMVTIVGSSRVTVRGLDITGYRTHRLGVVPVGIYVHGHDQGVRLLGNHVHDLGNDNGTRGSFDINAHGIAVYGDDPHAAVTGLRIMRNRVDHLRLGASESVVVNGNVVGWRIVANTIRANNNIGIDAIGFEPTLTGKYRYTQLNRARRGLIADNTVALIRSKGNPSYYEDGGWCNCADGIYVDGGAHIRILHNRVRSSDIGIEVAAENARGTADHVLVARNRVTGSLFTGITTGGYCNGARSCGHVQTGSSHDNTFTHNTLLGNNQLDDGSPELLVQYHTYRDRFDHNTITATNHGHVIYGTVPGADSAGHPVGNRSDHNTFAVAGAPGAAVSFGWHGRTYGSFAGYRRGSGQDRHSSFDGRG